MPGDANGARSVGRAMMSRRRPAVLAAAALVLSTAIVGCSRDEGRELRAPRPDQTTTTTAPATAPIPPGDDAAAGSAAAVGTAAATTEPALLTSSVIDDGGEVPERSTCRGADVSPPLRWTGMPPGAVELAVVVRDIDADGFIHWVVAGLRPDLGGIAEATVPAGAVEATNGFGRPGWGGPCPPSGTHHYDFRVYALSVPSGVTPGEDGASAALKIESTAALASAVLGATATAG